MAIDYLIGFPENVKITLGPTWSGNGNLNPSDILLLTRYQINDAGLSESYVYSEGGTNTANQTDNRLQWVPLYDGNQTSNNLYAPISAATGTGVGLWTEVGEAWVPGLRSNYEFLDLFNAVSDFVLNANPAFITALNPYYNPDIFSSLSAAAVGDLNVLDGETAVPDDGSIDFGSVEIDAETTKTLTLENVGDLPLSLESATFSGADAAKFSIAGDSDWNGGDPVELLGLGTTGLKIEVDTSEAGMFEAVLTITSDDADEGTYEIDLTIEVSPASLGTPSLLLMGVG